MELTLEELKEKLSKCEETYLMELLQLTSGDLVDHFEDFIEEHFDELCGELEELDEGEDEYGNSR